MPGYPEITRKIITRTFVILLVFLLGINTFGPYQPKVSAAAGPDLIVQDISLFPADPAINDTVTITATVNNQGTASAGTNYVTCYIDSTILETKSVKALNAGSMAPVTFTWQATQGSHTIKVIADSSGIIAETDETNNVNMSTLTTLAPDLIIQSITWSPTNPSVGDNIIFSITIKNQGNIKSHFTDMNFFINGNTRGIQDVAAINPGALLAKTYRWTALTGQYVLKAVVDETNNNKESDETNNELTVAFATEAPDLAFQKVVWTPQNPSKFDTVTCNVTVINQGQGRADSWYLDYFLDGALKSTLLGSSLESGASVNVTFSWQTMLDKHEIKFHIGYYSQIIESDESNNEYTVSITTLLPDLIVSDVSWLPANPCTGDNVTFAVKFKNQGSGRAAIFRAISYIDNRFISYLNISAIDAGAEAIVTFQWIATSGSHSLRIFADFDRTLNEKKRDNNDINVSITIISPDLIIQSISWSPENPTVDDIVTFTANITNQGGGRAATFYVAYFMDDTPLTSELITRLDAGASVNGTCTWKVTNGRHTFRAIANYNNYIVESDKTNNENSIVFAPRLPDLVITSIIWLPPDMPAGNDVTFDITIENQGLLSAGPSRIAYYVDGADAGYTYIGQLEAGASTIQHFKWAASGGQHTINIVVDSNNQIVEIDETNNIKVINIPLPDLIVQDITFTPTDAPIGDTVVITASVKNQGSSKTENSLINLYIDGIKIASEELPQIDTGDSILKSFNWAAEAGVHTFKITADINNTVIEVNETNNEKEIRFTTMTPDLIVDGISWLSNNDESTFTITVKNMGTGTAGASQVKYSFDGAPADIKDLGPIQAGEIAQFSFIAILSQGLHTAYITADYNNNIIELDENNNNSVISFSTLAPDLIIRTITYSPLDAATGDNITITAKVENRGTAQASNLRIALSIDGSMVDYIDIPEMKIAAITTVEFTWVATEGQHEITVFADADQTIVESNELNNSKSRTISFEKTKAPVQTTGNTTTAPASDGGFISSWWWLLLLIAGLLGVVAFLPTLRSLIKK